MQNEPKSSPQSSARLPFLDGLRGVAALYVVLHHAWFNVYWTGGETDWPGWLKHGSLWLMYGGNAVNLFIVLSGFCLALPVVMSEDKMLPGGLAQFARRRARRILPPYYAAVAVSLLLIACFPMLRQASGERWDAAIPAFTPGVIASHLLLFHNLSTHWIWGIDPPMWSVAVEWQIYFLFALLLVPVYRKMGMGMMVLLAVCIGAVLPIVHPTWEASCPWMLGLFAFGALVAEVCFGTGARAERLRSWPGWQREAQIGIGIYAANLFVLHFVQETDVLADLLIGAIAAVVMIDLVLASTRNQPRRLLKLLNTSIAQKLGKFSYSLYLIHFPLLALAHLAMRQAGWSANLRLGVMMAIVTPLTVLAGYLFYLAFERRFLPKKQRVDISISAKIQALSRAA